MIMICFFRERGGSVEKKRWGGGGDATEGGIGRRETTRRSRFEEMDYEYFSSSNQNRKKSVLKNIRTSIRHSPYYPPLPKLEIAYSI
jgi:hypothetical protein